MLLSGKKMFALETYGPTGKQCFRNKNHTWEHQMFLNLVGNIFASREVNFVSGNNVSMRGLNYSGFLRLRLSQKPWIRG
jgi:hypothetical protein